MSFSKDANFFDDYDPYDSYDSNQSHEQSLALPTASNEQEAVGHEEARIAALWFEGRRRQRQIQRNDSRRKASHGEDRPVDLDEEMFEPVKETQHDDATIPTLGEEHTQISNATSDRTPVISNSRRNRNSGTTGRYRNFGAGGSLEPSLVSEEQEDYYRGDHNFRSCRRKIVALLLGVLFLGIAVMTVSAVLGTRNRGSTSPDSTTRPDTSSSDPVTASPTVSFVRTANSSPPTSSPSISPTEFPSYSPSMQPSTPLPTTLPSLAPSFSWESIDLSLSETLRGRGGQFGASIALNDHMLVVASPFSNETAVPGAGEVLVRLAEGNVLRYTGSDENAALGSALDILDHFIAMGEPSLNRGTGLIRIYDIENDRYWGLDGPVESGYAGASLSFSRSPRGYPRLAVGAPFASSTAFLPRNGQIIVYELNDDQEWKQLGNAISGATRLDGFGSALDLQGDYLAASSPRGGYVNVHRFNNDNWEKVGQDMINPIPRRASDRFGHDVSMTILREEIVRVAVGAPWKEVDQSEDAGTVELFQLVNTDWQSIGSLRREVPSALEEFGSAVLLEGDFLAIGVPGADQGVVEIYTRNSSESMDASWILADTLVGTNTGDDFGVALSLSRARYSSMRFAVGAIGGDGYCRIYNI